MDVERWTFPKIDEALPHHRRQPRGIGRAIAEKLAGAEHTLLLHGRDQDALAKTCSLIEAKSGKTIPLCYDLRHTDSIEKMLKEIGSAAIDALINNAGIAVVKPLGEITLEEWETILQSMSRLPSS